MAPQHIIVCYLAITETKAFFGIHLEQVFDDAYEFTTAWRCEFDLHVLDLEVDVAERAPEEWSPTHVHLINDTAKRP